jgi:hypothetical protein
MKMTLEQALDHATETLPDNWVIRIEAMGTYAGVVVERPDLSEVDMNDDELDLVEQVLAGVKLAQDENGI